MGGWSKTALKSLLLPGGLLLLVVAGLLHGGLLTLAVPTLTLLYRAALVAGMLLSWRFRSTRTFFALLVLFLAQQSLGLFAAGRVPAPEARRTVVEAVGLLLPLNFVLLSLAREQGFTFSSLAPTSLFLFVESVAVAVLCRTPQGVPATAHTLAPSVSLPDSVLFVFVVAELVLGARFFWFRKPMESGLFWSLAAFFLGMHFGVAGRIPVAYFAAAASILAITVIETSYLLAYHDELTTLPSRRAFNDALLHLQMPYSIAMVDIDHFKRFNDTYGHDTGDEVLRLVASRLARVAGGGHAFRCGGEEFAILFSGKTTADVTDHLEELRATIESSSFRMRSSDRRQISRGPDRRNQRSRGRVQAGRAIRQLAKAKDPAAPLSVTVSIGVATSKSGESDPDQVIQSADKALYRAKAAGRNRVETASIPRRRTRAKTAGIA